MLFPNTPNFIFPLSLCLLSSPNFLFLKTVLNLYLELTGLILLGQIWVDKMEVDFSVPNKPKLIFHFVRIFISS